MCELWCNIYSVMETGWKWSLSLQCLRSLLQNEWTEQTSCQTKEEIGKYYFVADNQKKKFKNSMVIF